MRAFGLLLATVFALATHPAAAQARLGPSFDCAADYGSLGRMVCTDPTLARTELAYTQAFYALRHQWGEPGHVVLRQQSKSFFQAIYARCNLPAVGPEPTDPDTIACVSQTYLRQRDAWLAPLDAEASEEATHPVWRHVQLQADLQTLGYLPWTEKIDGVYGAATRAAITAWQLAHVLVPTGFMSDLVASGVEQDIRHGAMTPPDQQRAEAQAAEQRRVANAAEGQLRMERERLAAALADQRRGRVEAERQRAQAAAAQAQAERQAIQARRADLERRNALVRSLDKRLGGTADTAILLAQLGPGSALHRTLAGDLARTAGRSPAGCALVPPDTPAPFLATIAAATSKLALGSDSIVTPCQPDTLARADLVLVHRLGDTTGDAAPLEALAHALDNGAEPVLRVSYTAWRQGLERERQVALAATARDRALADAIRTEALAGTLKDWAVLATPGAVGAACLVAEPAPAWSRTLHDLLPDPVQASLTTISAVPDAEQQFARLLTGDCAALVVSGPQAGPVLRAAAANRHPIQVAPVRLSPTTMARVQAHPPPDL